MTQSLRSLIILTVPEWNPLLALKAIGIQRLDEFDEGLLRCHGLTHAVIEDYLLVLLGDVQFSKSDTFGVGGPILVVIGLVGPN